MGRFLLQFVGKRQDLTLAQVSSLEQCHVPQVGSERVWGEGEYGCAAIFSA